MTRPRLLDLRCRRRRWDETPSLAVDLVRETRAFLGNGDG